VYVFLRRHLPPSAALCLAALWYLLLLLLTFYCALEPQSEFRYMNL